MSFMLPCACSLTSCVVDRDVRCGVVPAMEPGGAAVVAHRRLHRARLHRPPHRHPASQTGIVMRSDVSNM